jgi:predicted AAA+ superfamily ATPase
MIGNVSGHGFRGVLATLCVRMGEAAPGRIQLLVGPRQVGKTTLLLELAREFGSQAVYPRKRNETADGRRFTQIIKELC